ncbi:hypothetical protein T484DRAFT_1943377 [Baffinella frigidus]|nr:hypothetical protein T484DRAFT_1943377 [Cryptophyta sp. CCMP2293]|mmetsp:Transcript_58172/g.138471  ORF Transcript_58172/g.138471 Transcript_58172/m.138471 type:complete len:231 (-) Transcript_58172:208-900(-)
MNAVRFVWGHLVSAPKNLDQELYVDEECGHAHAVCAEGSEQEAGPASRVSGWVPGLGWLLNRRSALRHSALVLHTKDSSGHGRSMMERYLLDQTGLEEHAGGGDSPSGESSDSLEAASERRALDGRGGSSDGSCAVRFNSSMASGQDTQGNMVAELSAFDAPPQPLVSFAIPAHFLGYKLNLVFSDKAHEPEADTRARVTLWGWAVGLRATLPPPPADAGPVDALLLSAC